MLDRVLVGCPPVAMAAGLREKRPARQDSRPSQQPLRDHLRPRRVESPGISDGGEALVERLFDECGNAQGEGGQGARRPAVGLGGGEMDVRVGEAGADIYTAGQRGIGRSEEHTSELQSRLHLVCRLLLEKKKKIIRLY